MGVRCLSHDSQFHAPSACSSFICSVPPAALSLGTCQSPITAHMPSHFKPEELQFSSAVLLRRCPCLTNKLNVVAVLSQGYTGLSKPNARGRKEKVKAAIGGTPSRPDTPKEHMYHHNKHFTVPANALGKMETIMSRLKPPQQGQRIAPYSKQSRHHVIFDTCLFPSTRRPCHHCPFRRIQS